MNKLQVGLDLVGLIPVVGEVAAGLNGIIYAARGDKLNASLSFAAMIPVAGNAATAGKWINKGANATKDIAAGVKNANKSAGTVGKNTPSSNSKQSNGSKPPAKDSKPVEATKGTDKVVKEYDVVPYRPANGKYGLENHHGVMNEWAKQNIPGYKEKVGKSPTVALSDRNNGGMHEATKKVYREWLRERTGRPVGAKVDWKNVSPKEMQKLSEEMFDAAKVPEATRREYYSQLNKFLYSLD